MSSKCDVTTITSNIEKLGDESFTFENFMMKAASTAFSRVFPEVETQNIARIV